MSCFKGRMREYRNISLDRFDGQNLKSSAFFLSHIHEDHTVGLDKPAFLESLQARNDICLYCSEVTKLLLVENKKYGHLEKYVRVLPIDKPTNVSIPQQSSCKVDTVQVTLLHAAHCPGSVMFLFEGPEGTCLYTGDFRWESHHITNITALHDKNKSVKHIDSLYVDTTFCHESSIYIPSREDSANAVCALVKEWLAKGDNHVVHFTPRSQYGHEHLLKDVFMKTEQKVHVEESKYRIYQRIPGLEDVFTSNSSKTKVHACKGKWSSTKLPCGETEENVNVMIILPSTMYFTMKLNLNLADIVEKQGIIYRVCYSFHSSYSEVKDLVTYLQPKFVRPNVKPAPDDTILKVQGRLNDFLKLRNAKKIGDSQRIKPLGKLKRSKFTKKRSLSENSNDSLDLCFGTPEKFPPPAKRTKIMESSEEKTKTGESSDEDDDSSYAGSVRSDSEISDICELNSEKSQNRPDSLSLPGQSLLDVLDDIEYQMTQGSQPETLNCRVCITDDEEQKSAVIVPSKSLEGGEYDIVEENGNVNDRGDNIAESAGFDHVTKQNGDDEEEEYQIKEGCETSSTPGQSLIAAVNEMETAEKGDNLNQRRKENRSDSYEDKFMMFLKNGENKVNLKSECETNSEAEKEIDRMIINSQNSEETSNNKSNLQIIDSDQMENQSMKNESTNEDSDLACENQHVTVLTETNLSDNQFSKTNENGAVTIDSSGSTICVYESLTDEGNIRQNDCCSQNLELDKSKDKHKKDKSGSYDLFGTDDEHDTAISSDDEILIDNDDLENNTLCSKNKTDLSDINIQNDMIYINVKIDRLNNSSCLGKSNNALDENCVVVECESDVEEERSILSGKLSRSNSLQGQNKVIECHDTPVTCKSENNVTDSVNKLKSVGHCENTAIVLDCEDLSDSDETIPPSQHSDASIETISPFATPVKRPNEGQSQRLKMKPVTSSHTQKLSPMKNQSILPYLSPTKLQSPEKIVCQMGKDMFITNNENGFDTGEETTESDMIDLTASDDDDDDTDDQTQDIFVID